MFGQTEGHNFIYLAFFRGEKKSQESNTNKILG